MKNKTFLNRYEKNFHIENYEKRSCLVAEDLQSRIIQFKSNYLTKKDISKQARALKKTLLYFI